MSVIKVYTVNNPDEYKRIKQQSSNYAEFLAKTTEKLEFEPEKFLVRNASTFTVVKDQTTFENALRTNPTNLELIAVEKEQQHFATAGKNSSVGSSGSIDVSESGQDDIKSLPNDLEKPLAVHVVFKTEPPKNLRSMMKRKDATSMSSPDEPEKAVSFRKQTSIMRIVKTKHELVKDRPGVIKDDEMVSYKDSLDRASTLEELNAIVDRINKDIRTFFQEREKTEKNLKKLAELKSILQTAINKRERLLETTQTTESSNFSTRKTNFTEPETKQISAVSSPELTASGGQNSLAEQIYQHLDSRRNQLDICFYISLPKYTQAKPVVQTIVHNLKNFLQTIDRDLRACVLIDIAGENPFYCDFIDRSNSSPTFFIISSEPRQIIETLSWRRNSSRLFVHVSDRVFADENEFFKSHGIVNAGRLFSITVDHKSYKLFTIDGDLVRVRNYAYAFEFDVLKVVLDSFTKRTENSFYRKLFCLKRKRLSSEKEWQDYFTNGFQIDQTLVQRLKTLSSLSAWLTLFNKSSTITVSPAAHELGPTSSHFVRFAAVSISAFVWLELVESKQVVDTFNAILDVTHNFKEEFNSKTKKKCPELMLSPIYSADSGRGSFVMAHAVNDQSFPKWQIKGPHERESNVNDVLDAFSHFVYERSQHQCVIFDLRPFLSSEGILLTEPIVYHKIDTDKFGSSNLGAKGIDEFMSRHVCNHFCRELNLPGHITRV